MLYVKDKKDCCGCAACQSVCPKHCIIMKQDEEGFLYPEVDASLCVDCKLCEKVCPVQNPLTSSASTKAYAVVTKNKEALKNSASGGFFLPLAEYVIDLGGVVFGAAYDGCMRVVHSYVETKEALPKFSGSKYVQSIIGGTFSQVRAFLKQGRLVLFSGTPCQIQGLYKFLGETEVTNLITLDFVCHGVPSPKVFEKYINYISSTYSSKVINFKFRTKKYGYNSYSYSYSYSQLSDGRDVWADEENKYAQFMFKSYFAEITSRPSCSKCAFKTPNHVSDFTVFDCWHWKRLCPTLNGEMGVTSMIVNSEKGVMIFDAVKEQYYYEQIDLNAAIKLDGISLLYSIPQNPKRERFFSALDVRTIPQLYDEFLEPNLREKIKVLIKNILSGLHILPFVRNVKYRLSK